MSVRILIAEDHTLVSRGLELMLSMTEGVDLVGTVDTAEQAVETARDQKVDVILMDVNFGPRMNGIEAAREIKKETPETKILILTMFTDPATVTQAVKAGVDGYLSKDASEDLVRMAIQEVMDGRSFLDPHVTEGILGRIGIEGSRALTDRELTVLQEISNGKSTREAAQAIHVSEDTVKMHLKQIYKKLAVRDRAEAVAEAFRRGLVH